MAPLLWIKGGGNHLVDGGGSMREVKFRAYFETKPKWLDSNMYYSDQEKTGLGDWFGEVEFEYYKAGEERKIMQWTGLQDKSGQDIYQDDILRVVEDRTKKFGNNPSYFKYGECGVVSWDARYTGWGMWHSDCEERESLGNLVRPPDWNFVEIIGSIYTDSHLLKEEQ